MRKSYGCEHSKIPSALADPYDNKQQKASNTLFSFPYRDNHLTQKSAAPTPAFCLCYRLSYSTCFSLKFGNEERRRVMQHHPFLAAGAKRKGQSSYTPTSPHATSETPVGSLYFLAATWCLEQIQAPSLNAASHWSPRSYSYALLRDGGVWPHTCAPGVTERCWTRTLKV